MVLGPPGKGKTMRVMKHFQPLTAADHPKCRRIKDRLPVPYYHGRITPAKWYIRGFQHQDDPLLILNDPYIKSTDSAWESMLCQFLETQGEREIRWDLKSGIGLDAGDQSEILRYFRTHGFPRSLRRQAGGADPDLVESLPELAAWDVGDEDEESGRTRLLIPSRYTTASQVILVANQLGRGWDRIMSRLRGFWYEPSVDSMLEDLARWDPPVPKIILGLLRDWHRRGEIINLDLRRVDDAIEDLRLGEDWESPLARSLVPAADDELLMDIESVLEWLAVDRQAKVREEFTEAELYHARQQFRPDKGGGRGNERRHRALEYLVAEEIIERCRPPRRPGALHGKSPGRGFRVLRLP
jgi:hypothetical protein